MGGSGIRRFKKGGRKTWGSQKGKGPACFKKEAFNRGGGIL